MVYYRFYFLDESGRIARHIEQSCDDDLAALKMAGSMAGECAIEVWADNRQIAHLNQGDRPHSAADAQSG